MSDYRFGGDGSGSLLMQHLGVLLGIGLALVGIPLLLFVVLVLLLSLAHPSSPEDPFERLLISVVSIVAVLLTWFGVRLHSGARRRIQEIRKDRASLPPEDVLERQPWLRHSPWRHREIAYSSPVRDSILVLALLFFTPLAVGPLWMGLMVTETYKGDLVPLLERLGMIGIGSAFLWIIVALIYWRLRKARYGTSVCRLLTVPGLVGGWLKADVECKLPAGRNDLVSVRLINGKVTTRRAGGRTLPEIEALWQMEQRIRVPVTSAKRTVVPVRLQIPRAEGQEPMPVRGKPASSWVLEITKEVEGIDFEATFDVPVFDSNDVPASDVVDAAPASDQARA